MASKNIGEKIGDSLWQGFKSFLKLGSRVGGYVGEKSFESLNNVVKNNQRDIKAKIDSNPNLDDQGKAVLKGLTNGAGLIAKGATTLLKHTFSAIKKEGER